jgi:MFS family permease
MICRELFSPDQYSAIYPKINLGVSVANAMGYPLLGIFFDRTGKYDGALIMMIGVVLLSIAGVFTVYSLNARKSQKTGG